MERTEFTLEKQQEELQERLTVRTAIFLYMRGHVSTLRPNSISSLTDRLKIVEDALGDELLNELKTHHWQQFFDWLAGQYCLSTVKAIRQAVKNLYGWFRRRGVVMDNPIYDTRSYGKEGKFIRGLTPEELRRLFANISPRIRDVVEFMVLTGLRVGEMAGLIFDDFNFTNDLVYKDGLPVAPNSFVVRRSWDAATRSYGPPKTKKSVRVIPLTTRSRMLVERAIEWRELTPDTDLSYCRQAKNDQQDIRSISALEERGQKGGAGLGELARPSAYVRLPEQYGRD